MIEIVIIIHSMLNIYRVRQKSLGYRCLLCTIKEKQGHRFFCNFLGNILFTRHLTTISIFIKEIY